MRKFRSNQGRDPKRNEYSYQAVITILLIGFTLVMINLINKL